MTGAELLPFDDPSARAAYGRLWAASPQRSVFAHPEVVEAVAAGFGLRVRLAAVPGGDGSVRGSGELAAALPVFEKRRGPLVVAALPPLVPFASPLLDGPLDPAAVHARRTPLDALLALLGSRYLQATLRLHPTLTDARPFLWAGWVLTPRYTYGLPLDGTDPLDGGSASVRRLVRRAAGAFRVEEGAHHAEAAVALMEASYHRRGRPLGLDGAAVRRTVRAAVAGGHARVFAALPAGGGPEAAPEAAVALAHDGRTAHYWITGGRPGAAMTVLLAEALARLHADGITYFDLVGANTPSIAEFKRRLGARLTLHFAARYHGGPLGRLLRLLRSG